MLVGDPIPHAALEARHEGDATGLQLVKPREIAAEARSATTTLPASNVHVRATVTSPVLPSVTLTKLGQVAGLVQPDVQLDRGLRSAERRPRENAGQTQVDGRRIDRTYSVVPEAETMARRPLLATTQQTAEQRFVRRCTGCSALTRVERRAADRPHAQVIELGGLSRADCSRCRAGSAGWPTGPARGRRTAPSGS